MVSPAIQLLVIVQSTPNHRDNSLNITNAFARLTFKHNNSKIYERSPQNGSLLLASGMLNQPKEPSVADLGLAPVSSHYNT
jgi:hypothetical protein